VSDPDPPPRALGIFQARFLRQLFGIESLRQNDEFATFIFVKYPACRRFHFTILHSFGLIGGHISRTANLPDGRRPAFIPSLEFILEHPVKDSRPERAPRAEGSRRQFSGNQELRNDVILIAVESILTNSPGAKSPGINTYEISREGGSSHWEIFDARFTCRLISTAAHHPTAALPRTQ
jgi:hypothetical protein